MLRVTSRRGFCANDFLCRLLPGTLPAQTPVFGHHAPGEDRLDQPARIDWILFISPSCPPDFQYQSNIPVCTFDEPNSAAVVAAVVMEVLDFDKKISFTFKMFID